MAKLSATGMEKLNEISTKYRFRDYFELEQEEAYNFCDAFLQCVVMGLNADREDIELVEAIRNTITNE